TPQASGQELAKLGSLGYISVSRGNAGPLPDPKDKVAALARYKRLFDLFYAKRDREAIAAAQEILTEDSAMTSVWRILGKSRERLGDLAGAAQALALGIERSPNASAEELSQTFEQLAGVQEKRGDSAAAEKTLRDASARGLASDAMKIELARLLAARGKASE